MKARKVTEKKPDSGESELSRLKRENRDLRIKVSVLEKAVVEAHGETAVVRLQAHKEAAMVTDELVILREMLRAAGVLR